MNRLLLLLALLLPHGLLAAQSMPMPPFEYTFQDSNIRGFHFVAPVNFTITGVRVPDESGQGMQVAGVYVSSTIPPTGVINPTFYQNNTPSSTIMPCNIQVNAGEYVGVIGACYNTTSTDLYSSYTPDLTHTSNILGNPVDIFRVTAASILTAGPIKLNSSTSGRMGRIEIYVQGQPAAAESTDFGVRSAMVPVSPPYVPLPEFDTIYSHTYSRGICFQAPVPIVITHLQVPNDNPTPQTHQAVALYKSATKWPLYSTLSQVTPIFYTDTALANTLIQLPAPVPIMAGEWVAAIGGCHTPASPTLSNSYARKGPFITNVLGHTVTMIRCGFQAGFIANKGAGPYFFREDYNSPTRVEIHLVGQSTAGLPIAPILTTTGRPGLGLTAELTLSAELSGALGSVVALSFGRLASGIPFPIGTLWVTPNFPLVMTVPGGASGAVTLPLPNDLSLVGGKVYFQGFTNALPANFGMSNGIEWTLGI